MVGGQLKYFLWINFFQSWLHEGYSTCHSFWNWINIECIIIMFRTFTFKNRYDRCKVSINLRILEGKMRCTLNWSDPISLSLFHSRDLHGGRVWNRLVQTAGTKGTRVMKRETMLDHERWPSVHFRCLLLFVEAGTPSPTLFC